MVLAGRTKGVPDATISDDELMPRPRVFQRDTKGVCKVCSGDHVVCHWTWVEAKLVFAVGKEFHAVFILVLMHHCVFWSNLQAPTWGSFGLRNNCVYLDVFIGLLVCLAKKANQR